MLLARFSLLKTGGRQQKLCLCQGPQGSNTVTPHGANDLQCDTITEHLQAGWSLSPRLHHLGRALTLGLPARHQVALIYS